MPGVDEAQGYWGDDGLWHRYPGYQLHTTEDASGWATPPAEQFIQPSADKIYSLALPLGHSSISSQHAPAWDISFLYNSASAFTSYIELPNLPYGKRHTKNANVHRRAIPQSEVEILYQTYATRLDEYGNLIVDYVGDQEEVPGFSNIFFKEYLNNSTLQTKEDYLLLSAVEENVDFKKENFDIEVFELEFDDDGEVANEKQLFFLEDRLVLENLSMAAATAISPEDYVEYWFDIFVDDEIDSAIFCKAKLEEKGKNIFADQFNVYNCPELEEKPTYPNIYEVLLTDEDFEDPC
jgi:hypothetical protein